MKRKFNYKKFFNDLKKRTEYFIKNNKIFLIYVVICLLIGFLLRLKTIGHPILLKGSISDLLVILLIGSFSYLMKKNYRFIYYLIWIIFFSALSIGNTIYYEFYQSFLSVNLLSTASMIGQVNDALWDKIHFHQFLYLLFPIIFGVIYHLFKKYKIKDGVMNGKKTFIGLMISVGVILLIMIPTVSKTDTSRFVKLWNRESVVQKYGLYVYTINDLIQGIRPTFSQVFGYDEAATKFRNYYACKFEEKKETNKYTNTLKGKNVIFIHAESIQNFIINLKINGQEVTPNLNKLVKKSMYFSKFYPQISVGTSSDTEFTLNTGLMPSSSGTVFVNYFDRTYYALPKYFKDMGYYTFSAHANNAEYWNRKAMHANLGYDEFYAKDRFEIPNEEDPDYIGLGLSDKGFFNQFTPMLKDIETKNKKFYGTIITLTNHSPFGDVEKYGEFDVTMKYTTTDETGKKVQAVANYLEGTSMGNYLKSAHYADQALGEFINNLEKEGLLKNTVVIIYGDHEARLPKKDFNVLYNYDPENDTTFDLEEKDFYDVTGYNYDLLKNTPLIIYNPAKHYNKNIKKVMGMYDVLPTMANLFGFEEKYSLGHDVFSKREGMVVFPNGNVLTDKIYYSYLNDEYIAFTDKPIELDYINELKTKAEDILSVSNGIVVHDLIKKESDKIGACIHE